MMLFLENDENLKCPKCGAANITKGDIMWD